MAGPGTLISLSFLKTGELLSVFIVPEERRQLPAVNKLRPNTPFRAAILACLLATGLLLASFAQKQPPAKPKASKPDAATFKITVVPVGPTDADLQALKQSLLSQPAVKALQSANFRHLYTQLSETDQKTSRFSAVFYDYTNQRAFTAEGPLSDPAASVVRVENGWQPPSSEEEFQDAVSVLRADPTLGNAITSGELTTYRPMPPVLETNADGSPVRARVVNVGLLPASGTSSSPHQIVGVDLVAKKMLTYPQGKPANAQAETTQPPCGATGANQSTTGRGTAGQYQMTVTDGGGQPLWEMLIIRPSASSGTRASAIEIQNVKYKGRTVLKRGHVPILNVKYVDGQCGPYRDWQYQEGMFQATGTDVAPGIRDCGTTVATTEVDTGVDTGNFKGVAIYREGSEVVLLTEMEAGWYRYVDEWRFDANGTIRPRYGFGAVVNSCTCLTHDHHVYWRFDLDIDGPTNSIYELEVAAERSTAANGGRPLLMATENKTLRAGAPARFYWIRNAATGRSCVLNPGSKDGAADTYGRGDMWFLRYKTGSTNLQNEFDDGHNSTSSNTEADLDQFVNNESLRDQDSVIWYHATLRHSPSGINSSMMCMPAGAHAPGSAPLAADNLIGPDLILQGF